MTEGFQEGPLRGAVADPDHGRMQQGRPFLSLAHARRCCHVSGLQGRSVLGFACWLLRLRFLLQDHTKQLLGFDLETE